VSLWQREKIQKMLRTIVCYNYEQTRALKEVKVNPFLRHGNRLVHVEKVKLISEGIEIVTG